ncbi:hypothetical protein TcCL_ESM05226, partial [Trypanosoma cruzi]
MRKFAGGILFRDKFSRPQLVEFVVLGAIAVASFLLLVFLPISRVYCAIALIIVIICGLRLWRLLPSDRRRVLREAHQMADAMLLARRSANAASMMALSTQSPPSQAVLTQAPFIAARAVCSMYAVWVWASCGTPYATAAGNFNGFSISTKSGFDDELNGTAISTAATGDAVDLHGTAISTAATGDAVDLHGTAISTAATSDAVDFHGTAIPTAATSDAVDFHGTAIPTAATSDAVDFHGTA